MKFFCAILVHTTHFFTLKICVFTLELIICHAWMSVFCYKYYFWNSRCPSKWPNAFRFSPNRKNKTKKSTFQVISLKKSLSMRFYSEFSAPFNCIHTVWSSTKRLLWDFYLFLIENIWRFFIYYYLYSYLVRVENLSFFLRRLSFRNYL